MVTYSVIVHQFAANAYISTSKQAFTSLSLARRFHFYNIRSVKFTFTAGNMYVMDKGLIITLAGGMVTYGVIVHQFATNV